MLIFINIHNISEIKRCSNLKYYRQLKSFLFILYFPGKISYTHTNIKTFETCSVKYTKIKCKNIKSILIRNHALKSICTRIKIYCIDYTGAQILPDILYISTNRDFFRKGFCVSNSKSKSSRTICTYINKPLLIICTNCSQKFTIVNRYKTKTNYSIISIKRSNGNSSVIVIYISNKFS